MSNKVLGVIAAVLILTGLALLRVPGAEATAPSGYDITPVAQGDDGSGYSCHAEGEGVGAVDRGGAPGSPELQPMMDPREIRRMMELPPEEMAKDCDDATGPVADGVKGRDV